MTGLRAGQATDIGRVRDTNQDFALVTDDLVAVADGMGGHAGGEVAARLAIDALRDNFAYNKSTEGLRRAAARANEAVFRRGQADAELHGMGTTLTAAALLHEADDDVLEVINVGDSRAYLLDEEELVQITNDHSLAEEMVRRGELSAEQAELHPHRHILTRALGIDRDVEVDSWRLRLHPPARLLLCSDGLSNELSTDEIAAVLRDLVDPQHAADELVQRALQHGGSDNVTVVVLDVLGEEPRRAETEPPAHDARTSTAEPTELAEDGAEPTVPEPAGPLAPAAAEEHAASLALDATGGAPQPSAGLSGAVVSLLHTSEADVTPARLRLAAPPRAPRAPRSGARSATRLVTGRVVLFSLVFVALIGGVIGFTIWFNNASYFVGLSAGKVAIFQGRPGGLLWFKPTVVEVTNLAARDVLSANLPSLRAGILESSFASAKVVVDNLSHEKGALGIGPTLAGPNSTLPTKSSNTTASSATRAPSATSTQPASTPSSAARSAGAARSVTSTSKAG